MPAPIHVCCGSKGPAHDLTHDPVRMKVDKNGVAIYRKGGESRQKDEYEPGHLILFDGMADEQKWLLTNYPREDKPGTNLDQLFVEGGEYYGDGDRMVCPVCGATIVWRI